MFSSKLPPLFFSSIPKCGKNVIYSFFFALGYKRFQFLNDSYNHYSNYISFGDFPGRDHYVSGRENVHDVNPVEATRIFHEEMRAICAGQIAHRHMHPDRELLDALRSTHITPIFIYRDPRDCLLSAVHYAFKGKPAHVSKVLANLSEEDAALKLISGGESLIPFARWFNAYLPWLKRSDVISLKFEDVIGARGGGSDEMQFDQLRSLVRRLGIHIPDEKIDLAISQTFNPRAGTFRSGQIGGWQTSFTEKVNCEFRRNAGYLLGLWGYSSQ